MKFVNLAIALAVGLLSKTTWAHGNGNLAPVIEETAVAATKKDGESAMFEDGPNLSGAIIHSNAVGRHGRSLRQNNPGQVLRRVICKRLPRLCRLQARRFTPTCDLNSTSVGELGFVLNASYHLLDLLYNVTQQLNCENITAYSNLTLNECLLVVEATSRMLEPSGSCHAALDSIARNSTAGTEDKDRDLAYDPAGKEGNVVGRLVCGGNSPDCNDITGCQITTAICDYKVSALGPPATYVLDRYLPRVLAQAGTALFDRGFLRVGLQLALRAHPLTSAALVIGASAAILYCGYYSDKCKTEGAGSGLTCNGAACCPDETPDRCGLDCCCCGLGFVPTGPSCSCVAA